MKGSLLAHTLRKAAFVLLAVSSSMGLIAQDMGPASTCTLNGTWRGSDGSSGTLVWQVLAEDICCGMFALAIQDGGNNSDEYGRFTISGEISGEGALFEQVYSSGQLSGRVYDYEGDVELNHMMEVNSITGRYSLRGEGPRGTFRFDSLNCGR